MEYNNNQKKLSKESMIAFNVYTYTFRQKSSSNA